MREVNARRYEGKTKGEKETAGPSKHPQRQRMGFGMTALKRQPGATKAKPKRRKKQQVPHRIRKGSGWDSG
jgi:hypothetical protein